ncbi:MAG: DUF3108 domain-containing protein [Opitutus sp.]|nr:DUF3108 domain-containing protein [Opitutus sp.]
MILRLSRVLTPLPFLWSLTQATPSLPLQDGEHLTYRVSWAIVPGAGDIKIEAHTDATAPEPCLIVTTTTSTRRLARLLLPFDAEARSIFDLQSGRLLSLTEKNSTREKKAEHTVSFNYTDRTALYTVPGSVPPPCTLTIPAGDPVDLIMGLLQTRSWDLKPGETRDALVLFDDDFYELTIHMARYEEMRTLLGTFQTVVLEPRMDKTPPRGMFKRGSSVRVWIAQDVHRLPVKFEVEFNIGTGTATLEAYQPGPARAMKPAASSDAKNSRP